MEAVDVRKQAQQGSMAAIIQILNEQLSDRKVRTRAVLTDGVLQLLCEANEEAALDQATLVPQIRETLEAIQPRNLRRVKIFSRIAQEQQMLWLEEMAKNPDHSILWTELIVLQQVPFWQQIRPNFRLPDRATKKQNLAHLSQSSGLSPIWRNVIGIVALCLVSFVAGHYYQRWNAARNPSSDSVAVNTSDNSGRTSGNGAGNPVPVPDTLEPQTEAVPAPDSFAQAVRLAEAASLGGKQAQTAEQWQALAQKWQQAADLMGQVPASDDRYDVARDRTQMYTKNSQLAKAEAAKTASSR